MKRIVPIVSAVLLSGCLSSAPKSPVAWNIDVDIPLRVGSVDVCAPYDGVRFAVLRAGGSVAFDSYNVFAARPASLFRSAFLIDSDAEDLVVRRIALDCREKGRRDAVVELQMLAPDRHVVKASAAVPTADGDYTRAFSAALKEASEKLIAGMKR